jgi:hypothetical protein
MKTQHLFTALVLLFSCQQPKDEKTITKSWQGQSVDFSQIREVVNTYHMFDSTGTKVGSMVFGFSFEDGMLVARDTSQFDDGSVYETAVLTFDTSVFEMKKVAIDIKMSTASLDVDLRTADNRVIGSYVVNRDTTSTSYPIDSAYQYTAFREEIYMLTHSLRMEAGDTLSLDALVPTSMGISKAQMIYSESETIEAPGGMTECDVIWLKTDGKMPDNKIWITKDSPRTIAKFYVPGAELDIVLVSQK